MAPRTYMLGESLAWFRELEIDTKPTRFTGDTGARCSSKFRLVFSVALCWFVSVC